MLLGVDRAESIRAEPIIGQRHLALLALAALLTFGVLIGVASNGRLLECLLKKPLIRLLKEDYQ